MNDLSFDPQRVRTIQSETEFEAERREKQAETESIITAIRDNWRDNR